LQLAIKSYMPPAAMQRIFLPCALLLLGLVAQAVPPARNYVDEFRAFMDKFQKAYDSDAEFTARFEAFVENIRFIEQENAKETNTYTLGLNEFADMSFGDFQLDYLGYAPPKNMFVGLPYLGPHKVSNTTLPSSVDWRDKKAVTPVKNQGQCGSCWAFSTTGSLEGAFQIAAGKLVSLSEQQLVDCAKSYGEAGCQGGEMDGGFQYAKANGLDTEASYPYRAKNGICKASSGTIGLPKGAVTGYHDVSHQMEALMDAVAQQPVSIAIEADKSAFQLYRGGVLSKTCGTKLDHGVLCVGYGTDSTSNQDYWLIKNSWGTTWGEQGFGRLLRGKNSKGECGILMQPSYPVVSGEPGPSPGPSPPPSPPSPPSPGSSHYEKPPCQADEVDVQVQGITGETCSPKCTGVSCPTDVPSGTTAQPKCILQDSASGDKYCALSCFLGGCPPGASCKHSGLIGICMYPQSEGKESSGVKTLVPIAEVVV